MYPNDINHFRKESLSDYYSFYSFTQYSSSLVIRCLNNIPTEVIRADIPDLLLFLYLNLDPQRVTMMRNNDDDDNDLDRLRIGSGWKADRYLVTLIVHSVRR